MHARAAKQLDESIAALNLTNPYTKEPIRNKADYDAYRAKVEEDRRAKFLKKAGVSEEEFAKLAAEQPEIKARLNEAQEAKRQAAAATMSEQMRQIHELDPEINTIEDLAKMPNYAQFYRFVKQNRLSLVEAYKLTNMERLSARTAAATKRRHECRPEQSPSGSHEGPRQGQRRDRRAERRAGILPHDQPKSN